MSDWQDFKDYQLHSQARDVWREKKTGVLNCETRGYENALFFKDGVVHFASSNDPDNKLPQILIGQGCFTEDQYESVLPNFKEELSVGRNLVEMGLISQQELIQGAKEQVYKIFEGVVNSEDGRFSFTEDDLPQGIVSLPLTFPKDLFRAFLALEDKTWFAQHFDSMDFICEKNADHPIDFNKVAVADYAEEVYGLIDGEQDFNHLVFEASIEEFVLLKFLYALEVMGHISFRHPEPEEGQGEPEGDGYDDFSEPEEEVGDVRDELNDALARDDEINRLNMVSMDETIDLPSSMLRDQAPIVSPEDEPVAMDATMEIARSEIGMDDEIVQERLGDSGADLEEEPAEEEVVGGWTEVDDEPEEAGLDDLADETDDILAQELKRMAEPLMEMEQDPYITDHPEESEDEASDDEVSEKKQPDRKRLLIIAAILTAVGLVVIALPYVWDRFSAGPYDVDQELAHFDQPEQGEETPPENDPNENSDAVTGAEIVENDQPLDAETSSDPKPITPDQDSEGLNPDQIAGVDPEPPEKTALVESGPPDNTEATTDQEPEPKFNPQPQNTAEDAPAVAADASSTDPDGLVTAEMRGFHSPIADKWDTKIPEHQVESYGESMPDRVGGDDQAGESSKSESLPAKDNEAQPVAMTELKTISPPDADQTASKQITANNTRNAENKPDPSPEVKTTAKSEDNVSKDLAGLMASGNYQEAARGWAEKQKAVGDQYTIALFMVCEPSSVRKAVADSSGDAKLFILPHSYQGDPCFWVCWGVFPTRLETLKAIENLPEAFSEETPEATRINKILPK